MFLSYFFFNILIILLAGPYDTTPEDAMEISYEVPYYVKEIYELEKELRNMKYLPPKEENTFEKE